MSFHIPNIHLWTGHHSPHFHTHLLMEHGTSACIEREGLGWLDRLALHCVVHCLHCVVHCWLEKECILFLNFERILNTCTVSPQMNLGILGPLVPAQCKPGSETKRFCSLHSARDSFCLIYEPSVKLHRRPTPQHCLYLSGVQKFYFDCWTCHDIEQENCWELGELSYQPTQYTLCTAIERNPPTGT